MPFMLALIATNAAYGAPPVLYWSQFGLPPLIGHVNLDGSDRVTLPQTTRTVGMETLDATRHVYWIDDNVRAIMRANSDFTGVVPLVTGLSSPSGNVALDPAADLIFWSNAGSRTIGRANLSGGQILGTFSASGNGPDDLATDPVHQLLYWGNHSGEVMRSNYDGTGQVMLLNLVSDSSVPGATGLDLDLAAGKMYLSQPNSHRILRANLDGTGLETVLNVPERPFGMELFDGRMYWADLDGGRLRSANLDGTDVITGFLQSFRSIPIGP
jgi:hypothetical protein